MQINTSLVERLLRSQFPQWSHLAVEPVEFDGWDNRTFRLGRSMSVRLPSAEPYAEQVAKEQRWLPKLAPELPLPIPAPLALGLPCDLYPWHWSIYRWLEGDNASLDRIGAPAEFATSLASFFVALHRIDSTGGPAPGAHNFYRGGALTTYSAETRDAIETLQGTIAANEATELWEEALKTSWNRRRVWVHGDVAATNLLVRDGRLSAVIDFGCSAVGDPACDLTIAWTFFDDDCRRAFRESLALDEATWLRGRAWALWKALITLAKPSDDPILLENSRRVLETVLAERDS